MTPAAAPPKKQKATPGVAQITHSAPLEPLAPETKPRFFIGFERSKQKPEKFVVVLITVKDNRVVEERIVGQPFHAREATGTFKQTARLDLLEPVLNGRR